MKKYKNFLIIFLSFLLMSPNAVSAYNEESINSTIQTDRIDKTKEIAHNFLDSINLTSNLNKQTLLKNLNGDLEAVLYSLDNMGYIIVNVNDFSVPEMNLEGENPFEGVENPIYNGPFNYYSEKNENFVIDLKNQDEIQKSDITNIYSKKQINLYDSKLNSNLLKINSNNIIITPYASLNTKKTLPIALKTWTMGDDNCGSIASAIMMRYYYDYVDKSYVNSSQISQSSLISLMQKYVGYGKTGYSQLINGLDNYFKDKGLNNYVERHYYFPYSKVMNRIDNNRPVIVGTLLGSQFGSHWIIAHGYAQMNNGGTIDEYIIVNDGWGHNNVWVDVNSTPIDGIIYFAR